MFCFPTTRSILNLKIINLYNKILKGNVNKLLSIKLFIKLCMYSYTASKCSRNSSGYVKRAAFCRLGLFKGPVSHN